jgi:hypothetical protein
LDQRFDPQELRDLVRRLERQNRRLSLALLGVVALGAALLVGAARAAPTDATLEASRFVLKDARGETKGVFSVGPDGGGVIVLYGPDGQPVAELPPRTQMVPLRGPMKSR